MGKERDIFSMENNENDGAVDQKLEAYGVWVKSEPEDYDEGDDFQLEDLDGDLVEPEPVAEQEDVPKEPETIGESEEESLMSNMDDKLSDDEAQELESALDIDLDGVEEIDLGLSELDAQLEEEDTVYYEEDTTLSLDLDDNSEIEASATDEGDDFDVSGLEIPGLDEEEEFELNIESLDQTADEIEEDLLPEVEDEEAIPVPAPTASEDDPIDEELDLDLADETELQLDIPEPEVEEDISGEVSLENESHDQESFSDVEEVSLDDFLDDVPDLDDGDAGQSQEANNTSVGDHEDYLNLDDEEDALSSEKPRGDYLDLDIDIDDSVLNMLNDEPDDMELDLDAFSKDFSDGDTAVANGETDTEPGAVEDDALPGADDGQDRFDLDAIPDLDYEESLPELDGDSDFSEDVVRSVDEVDTSTGTAETQAEAEQPGAPTNLSSIESELHAIRSELLMLRQELKGLRSGDQNPHGEQKSESDVPDTFAEEAEDKGDQAIALEGDVEPKAGFFDDDEDETIALTGDELDNILNTAEFVEATGEGDDVEDDLILTPDPIDGQDDTGESEPIVETSFSSEQQISTDDQDTLPSLDDYAGNEEEVANLASMDIEKELAEIDQLEEEEEVEIYTGDELEEMEIEIPNEPSEAEPDSIPDFDDEAQTVETDQTDEILEDGELEIEPSAEVDDADLELDDLDIEEPTEELSAELDEEDSGIELEDNLGEHVVAEDDYSDDQDELSLDDSDLNLGDIEQEAEDPLDTIVEEVVEEDQLAEDEDDLSEYALSEEERLDEEISVDEQAPTADFDEVDSDAEEISLDDLEDGVDWEADQDESIDLVDEEAIEEDVSTEGVDESVVETPSIEAPSIKSELKSVLAYMDELLDALPDDKIEEFANSEHFLVYKKLIEELGI